MVALATTRRLNNEVSDESNRENRVKRQDILWSFIVISLDATTVRSLGASRANTAQALSSLVDASLVSYQCHSATVPQWIFRSLYCQRMSQKN
jgi:hypothetical protein